MRRQPYLGYLEALFTAELEDGERRAIPYIKDPGRLDFCQAPTVSPARLSELAEGM